MVFVSFAPCRDEASRQLARVQSMLNRIAVP